MRCSHTYASYISLFSRCSCGNIRRGRGTCYTSYEGLDYADTGTQLCSLYHRRISDRRTIQGGYRYTGDIGTNNDSGGLDNTSQMIRKMSSRSLIWRTTHPSNLCLKLHRLRRGQGDLSFLCSPLLQLRCTPCGATDHLFYRPRGHLTRAQIGP